jgi:diguanylate cyclase (GGDEF)-like protein
MNRSHRTRMNPATTIVVLFVLVSAAVAAPPVPAASAGTSSAFTQDIPSPPPTVIRPRVAAAWGAVMAAVVLGVLYFYRRRAFILYWVCMWLLLAAALAINARTERGGAAGRLSLGLSILFVVWSAGLAWLAATVFPRKTPVPVPLIAGATTVTAGWFLAAPFVAPAGIAVGSGVLVTLLILAIAGASYLTLGRASRLNGALLMGAGLCAVVLSNLVGAAAASGLIAGAGLPGQLAVGNGLASVLIVLGMFLLVFEDITFDLRRANRDLEALNSEVKRLAIVDPLTGCYNRRFFDEAESREIQRHRRYAIPLSVVFIDVRQFKRLNDTLGHDTGDQALRVLGKMLCRNVRGSDFAFRWGGDEFVLLLNCETGEAEQKAAELKAVFAREATAAALPAWLELSVGVSAVAPEAIDLRDAIKAADRLMYQDKNGPGGPA